MGRNRVGNLHRWKKSLSAATVAVLLELAMDLKACWAKDRKHPRSYPIYTGEALWEAKNRLSGRQPKTQQTPGKLPLPSSPPESLFDLIDDKIVKTVFEQQNSGSYRAALRQAARGGTEGSIAFRKLLNSIEAAYYVEIYEIIPKPRVNFLHRELLEIAEELELDQLTHLGFKEFLDDLCPCRTGHTVEAIQKMRKRLNVSRTSGG
jgi:hypothetical protein